MLKFKDFILESLDNKYPWVYVTSTKKISKAGFFLGASEHSIGAIFETKTGERINVTAYPMDEPFSGKGWYVAFDSSLNTKGTEFELTKSKDSLRVFATIGDIIKDFIKKKKMIKLSFDSKGANRTKLYAMLVKKFLPSWHSYTYKPQTSQYEHFVVSKNKEVK